MSPFDYIMALLSFVFALALTHLLMGGARMVRHRRRVTFSWPHALWMVLIFVDLVINWLGFWDAHKLKTIDLATVAVAVAMATTNYFVAALVTPEFETPEDYDLRRFHEREGRTYLGAFVVFGVVTFAANAGGDTEGIAWSRQNGYLLLFIGVILAAFVFKNRIVQIAAPLIELAGLIYYALIFYPAIS